MANGVTAPARWRRPAPLLRVAAAGLLAFLMVLLLVGRGVTRSEDAQVLLSLHSLLVGWGVASTAADVFSVVAATTRGAVLPLICSLLSALWLLRHRAWAGALGVVVILAGGSLLDVVIKMLVHRGRPQLVAGIHPPGGFAYPSGHATSAICGILAPALIMGPLLRSRRAGRTLLAAALLAVVLTDLSRLVLVAHWPTDVVGGTLLGVTWSALVWAAVLAGGRPGAAHRSGRTSSPDP
ncbi:MAG: hypothetical protein NVSMB29_16600 [Candidatus Dormibacteria bacterium]